MSGPCLVRKDVVNAGCVATCNEICNPTVIYLNKKKITVGRAKFSNYRILSSKVTYNHLKIESEAANWNEWFFTSSKGGKGTFVNDRKVNDGVRFCLKDGDVIRLGIAIQEPINVFVFRLPSIRNESLRAGAENRAVKELPKQPKKERRGRITETPIENEQKKQTNIEVLETELKRKNILSDELKRQVKSLEAKVQRLSHENEEKIRVKEAQLIVFDRDVKMTREQLLKMIDEKMRLNERLDQVLQKQQQRDRDAVVEKRKVESALHYSSFASRVLQELVAVSECPQSFEMTNDLASIVTNVLEAELKCGVCTELLIEAMTLECSHTFCSYCVSKQRETSDSCPICRRSFTMFTKTLVLDGFIDKVLDLLSPKLKLQRKRTIMERKRNCL